MIWKNLFLSHRPQFKCNPLVGSLLNGIGSIASSLASSENQKAENQKNRDFALDMWNKTNEYNSPANQRKLLEQAGYNPYLYGNEYQGSGTTQPSAPASSPLPQFHNPVDGSVQMLQQGLQVESNVELQRMKMLETLANTMINLYKDGGQKVLDEFMEKFAPMADSLNWSGSYYEQMFEQNIKGMISQRYNTDMDSLLKDFEYQSNKEWTPKERQAHFEQMQSASKNLSAQCELWAKEGNYTEAKARAVASEVARNFAEAFQAKKIGDYYVVNAEQMDIINQMMDLDLEDKKADFAFNTSIRKWKKQIPNRRVAFDSFVSGIKSQQVQLGVQGNKFLQYGKEVTGMVGNLFKVNVGFSNSSANIRSNNRSYNESHSYGEINNVTPSAFPPVVPIKGF